MGFWSKTFTWWNGATWGTSLFTRRFGDEVGKADKLIQGMGAARADDPSTIAM